MSSAVRHQALRVCAEAPAAFRSMAFEVAGEKPAGLLASRAFWLGGLASVGVWTVVVLALVHAF